jgi:NAD(P)-dependent dehydrogenase (short-subunit alcohol dehydrogenase family)
LDSTGKVVLATGGATGIGRATSLAFTRQGATVAVGDVDDRAAETVRLIGQAGGTACSYEPRSPVAVDVKHFVSTAVETLGGLHVAFNNAGILPPNWSAARPDRG